MIAVRFPVLFAEGVLTTDGRMIASGGVTVLDPELPLFLATDDPVPQTVGHITELASQTADGPTGQVVWSARGVVDLPLEQVEHLISTRAPAVELSDVELTGIYPWSGPKWRRLVWSLFRLDRWIPQTVMTGQVRAVTLVDGPSAFPGACWELDSDRVAPQ